MLLFLPLGLWVLVWLGIGGREVEGILDSETLHGFFTRSRGSLPLFAAGFTVVMIAVKLSRQRSGRMPLFGPLGFAAVYGLVGLGAALLSPNGSIALYWAAAYLSVPLVLWGIVWGSNGLGAINRIISLNWLIIILAVATLFFVALLYLDLGALILTPSSWFDCSLYRKWQGHSWLDFSSGLLRPTGVARYAALAAILSLAALWQGRWRPLWVTIMLVSLILLLTSGSRGAFFGFGAGAAAIILLYANRKVVVGTTLGLSVLVAALWSTGAHNQFLDACIFRGVDTNRFAASSAGLPSTADLPSTLIALEHPLRVTIPEGAWMLEEVTVEGQGAPDASGGKPLSVEQRNVSDVFARVLLPTGLLIEELIPMPEDASANNSQRVGIPEGVWELKPLSAPEPDAGGEPLRIRVPAGLVLFDKLGPGETLDLVPPLVVSRDTATSAFAGRASVWEEGYRLFKEQPILGYGFHADRLLLGTHMHNTFMHALVQTGLIGTVPFIIALLFGWVLLIKALRNRANLLTVHQHLLIQVAGVLVFFSFRAVPESTGAFYGVDWLVLAPIFTLLAICKSGGLEA